MGFGLEFWINLFKFRLLFYGFTVPLFILKTSHFKFVISHLFSSLSVSDPRLLFLHSCFSPQFFFAASSSFLFLSVLVLLPFPLFSWLFFTCDLLSSVPCWLIYPQFVYLSIYMCVWSCFLMFLLSCFWFWTQLLKFIFAELVCHLCPCLYTPPFITYALLCWWWLNIMDINWAGFKHVYSFQS